MNLTSTHKSRHKISELLPKELARVEVGFKKIYRGIADVLKKNYEKMFKKTKRDSILELLYKELFKYRRNLLGRKQDFVKAFLLIASKVSKIEKSVLGTLVFYSLHLVSKQVWSQAKCNSERIQLPSRVRWSAWRIFS